jgi:hypothetical protein
MGSVFRATDQEENLHDGKRLITDGHQMRYLFSALPLFFVSCLAAAQDASLLAGGMQVDRSGEQSFAVNLSYTQRMGTYTAASVEYTNEGHPHLHHRDGLSPQLWLHTAVPERGFSFAVGAGPYYFFDTTTGGGALADYRNEHGWGAMVNFSAKYHLQRGSYVEARLSRIHGRVEHDSTLVMVGMGYELRDLPHEVKAENADSGENLVMLLAGRSIVNSFKSEKATSTGIEYRHTISPNAEWSVIAMNEGRIGVAERKGVSGQLWLLRPFTARTVLELGLGGYVMRDQIDRDNVREEPKTHFAPIASIGMRWRLTPDWRAQLSWSRVITDYHRDSDVFLVGAGKVF